MNILQRSGKEAGYLKYEMKALVVTPKESGSLRLAEVKTPEPHRGEVLVRVIRVGVDGTDIEINNGLYGQAPPDSDFLILGHESLGVVEKAHGNLNPGDLVVATVRRPCPEKCLNCRNSEVDMCITGNYTERGIKGIHGLMSEYYVEKPEYLLKIPPKLSDAGVLLEPLSIAEKGVSQIYEIRKRLYWKPAGALVLGAGSIGLFASMILRLHGLDVHTLDILEKDSVKAKIVEKIGADYIDGRRVKLQELPDKLGNIDIIFEATGNSSTALTAMSILGTNGVLCLTGITGGNKRLEICSDCLNMQIVLGNKLIFGTVNSNRKHFESGIKHMEEFNKKWPHVLEKFITRREDLNNFKEAFRKESNDIKVVIELSDEE